MICRRVYAMLILIGQSNLNRPIRSDGTKHRDYLRDGALRYHRDVFFRAVVTGSTLAYKLSIFSLLT